MKYAAYQFRFNVWCRCSFFFRSFICF